MSTEMTEAEVEPNGDVEIAKGSRFQAVGSGAGRLAVAGNPGKKGVRTWQQAGVHAVTSSQLLPQHTRHCYRQLVPRLNWFWLYSGILVPHQATAVVTLQKDNEGGGKKYRPSGIAQMCKERGLQWLHYPLSGRDCLGAPLPDTHASCTASVEPLELYKQGQSPDTISLTCGVEAVASLLREGESVVVHCDTGVQRSGIIAYLALRHCGLEPDESLQLLGGMRPIARKELVKGDSSLQKQAEMRLRSSQWQTAEGQTRDAAAISTSRQPLPQLHAKQEKKRVSWAEGESLQAVSFLPPTPRVLILRALELVSLAGDSEEACNDGGPAARAFFQAALLRLRSWADGEPDALRSSYSNRYGRPVPYLQEYAKGWSVLAGLYKGDATKLFVAATGGGDGVRLLNISAVTLPYVHTALETSQEGGACGLEGERVLADSLAALCDDTGLAAAGSEPYPEPEPALPTLAGPTEQAANEAQEETEDEAISAICSALDALYDERKHQQLESELAAARDLVVSRLEERQAQRDRLLAELAFSDDSDSE